MVKTKRVNIKKYYDEISAKDRSQGGSKRAWVYLALVALLWIVGIRYFAYLKMQTVSGSYEAEDSTIRYRISLEKKQYVVGEPIEVVLSVKNITERDVVLEFTKELHFDVVVYEMKDYFVAEIPSAIWKYSSEAYPRNKINKVVLNPGESRVYRAIWDQKDFSNQNVGAGEYIISGHLLAKGRDKRVVTRSRMR